MALSLDGLPLCGKVFPLAWVRCPGSPPPSWWLLPGVEGWPRGPCKRAGSAEVWLASCLALCGAFATRGSASSFSFPSAGLPGLQTCLGNCLGLGVPGKLLCSFLLKDFSEAAGFKNP